MESTMQADVNTVPALSAPPSTPAPAPPKRRRWWLLAGLAAVAVAGFLAFTGRLPLPGHGAKKAEEPSTGNQAAKVEEEPVAVTVAPVTPRPVRRLVPMVGTLHGFDFVVISPKVEGQVTEIYHDLGHVVKPGQPLLQVDRTNYEKALAEAEKALGLELAKLGIDLELLRGKGSDLHKLPGQVRTRLEGFKVEDLPAVVRAARNEQLALSQWERVQKSTLGVSPEERDRLKAEHDVAKANHQQAVLEVNTSVATIRQRIATLETAIQKLDDTTVVVPFPNDEALRTDTALVAFLNKALVKPGEKWSARPDEYLVAKKLVSVGTMVRSFPTVPVFELVRDHVLKLAGNLPERFIGEVQQPGPGRPPQQVDVFLEAYPGEVFEGWVSTVSPSVDTANRTFQVVVLVPNPQRKLRAGSFAKARIRAREETAVPTVPEEAVVSFAGVTKVFVVEDGKARAVPVKLGERLEIKGAGGVAHWVEVSGDLRSGSQVVTSGHSQLAEETPVRLRKGSVPEN